MWGKSDLPNTLLYGVWTELENITLSPGTTYKVLLCNHLYMSPVCLTDMVPVLLHLKKPFWQADDVKQMFNRVFCKCSFSSFSVLHKVQQSLERLSCLFI